ncbi:hypothetical protein CWI36_1973p0010 [Hamiltosporidium magnivora]|uniref:Uncharacterized protein n=1 Tax=Hamiltosporidium magnivora TaxID=148818 RepID=A0A4Q9KWZ6_9MICR|nr:hypothetical protein CWI36_1973p0010 [Hamiltosporidium magnivora]
MLVLLYILFVQNSNIIRRLPIKSYIARRGFAFSNYRSNNDSFDPEIQKNNDIENKQKMKQLLIKCVDSNPSYKNIFENLDKKDYKSYFSFLKSYITDNMKTNLQIKKDEIFPLEMKASMQFLADPANYNPESALLPESDDSSYELHNIGIKFNIVFNILYSIFLFREMNIINAINQYFSSNSQYLTSNKMKISIFSYYQFFSLVASRFNKIHFENLSIWKYYLKKNNSENLFLIIIILSKYVTHELYCNSNFVILSSLLEEIEEEKNILQDILYENGCSNILEIFRLDLCPLNIFIDDEIQIKSFLSAYLKESYRNIASNGNIWIQNNLKKEYHGIYFHVKNFFKEKMMKSLQTKYSKDTIQILLHYADMMFLLNSNSCLSIKDYFKILSFIFFNHLNIKEEILLDSDGSLNVEEFLKLNYNCKTYFDICGNTFFEIEMLDNLLDVMTLIVVALSNEKLDVKYVKKQISLSFLVGFMDIVPTKIHKSMYDIFHTNAWYFDPIGMATIRILYFNDYKILDNISNLKNAGLEKQIYHTLLLFKKKDGPFTINTENIVILNDTRKNLEMLTSIEYKNLLFFINLFMSKN